MTIIDHEIYVKALEEERLLIKYNLESDSLQAFWFSEVNNTKTPYLNNSLGIERLGLLYEQLCNGGILEIYYDRDICGYRAKLYSETLDEEKTFKLIAHGWSVDTHGCLINLNNFLVLPADTLQRKRVKNERHIISK